MHVACGRFASALLPRSSLPLVRARSLRARDTMRAASGAAAAGVSKDQQRVAVAQMTSVNSTMQNFKTCEILAKQAVEEGCSMLFLPENFSFMGASLAESQAIAESLGGPLMQKYQELARRQDLWLSLGGFQERIDNDTRIYNCHVIVNNEGEIVDCYRKIHLFDVAIDNGPTLTESAFTKPGKETKVLESPAGKLGLSTCYDIRFPELYERLATRGGADIIAIPSAFTVPTGQAHWEILVRARAIETQCYVVAAAQGGVHSAKRETFGRSLIVDPWGQVIAELEDRTATGIAVATLHLERLHSVRAQVPVGTHRVRRISHCGW